MFITFEGPDGSGKTTQVTLLADYLRQHGYPLFQTREPGGTAIGDQIRAVLHDMKNAGMHAHTEVLLYAASRAQLVAQEIVPRLAARELVLCDRYADSTLAYQGYGRGLDLDLLRALLRFATGGLRPDLTIYLDLTAEEGLERRQHAVEWNRLDAQPLEFHRRVCDGYRQLIAEEPGRWVQIPAVGDPAAIQAQVRAAVVARLPAPHPR